MNRMNQKQAIQLADWLRNNRDTVERMPIIELVALIGTDLSIRLNPGSLLRIANAVGVGVKLTETTLMPPKQDQLLGLAECLAELYDRLGEERPLQLSSFLRIR